MNARIHIPALPLPRRLPLRRIPPALFLLALLAGLQSCGRPEGGDGHGHGSVAEPGDRGGHEAAEAGHEGHDHAGGEAELSDLDRPLEELFAATCEHEVKTHECAECRYEVGVARAPRRLFEEGLLRLGRVERRAVELPLTLTGEVTFDEGRVTHLGPATPGVIRKVHVALGDRVRRGQALVELESAEAGEAQERFLEAEAQLARAERDYARVEELRNQAITSEKEFLLVRQELDAARIRLDTARGRLAATGLRPGDPLGRITLSAPEDGTVLSLHAVPGEIVHPEESLAIVGESRVLWVWCDLYERDIAALHGPTPAARRATVTVKAWPGVDFAGTVDFVSPAMDPLTRTAKVRVAVDNPEGRLMAGMFATARVFLPGGESVPAVPAAAVCVDEGRAFVFVPHHGDYFVRRPVVTGRTWAGWVELAEAPAGLSTLVADGVFLLKSDVLRSKMGAGCAD